VILKEILRYFLLTKSWMGKYQYVLIFNQTVQFPGNEEDFSAEHSSANPVIDLY